MTSSPAWELWTGEGYPSDRSDSSIYYIPRNVDIELAENRDALAVEIHRDGVAPTKGAAHALLESATVVHGQTETVEDETTFYTGHATDGYTDGLRDATWVELDEYED